MTSLRRSIFANYISSFFIYGSIMFIMPRARNIIWFLGQIISPWSKRIFDIIQSGFIRIFTRSWYEMIEFWKYSTINNFLFLKHTSLPSPKENPVFFILLFSTSVGMLYTLGAGVMSFPFVKSYLVEQPKLHTLLVFVDGKS